MEEGECDTVLPAVPVNPDVGQLLSTSKHSAKVETPSPVQGGDTVDKQTIRLKGCQELLRPLRQRRW